MAPIGDPKASPKPEPIGNMALLVVFTTCTMCALFVLWRRADGLRRVVAHQMKTWTRHEGRIRLSEDDGPAATEFLGDDPTDEGDDDGLEWDNGDDEPLPAAVFGGEETRLAAERERQAMSKAAAFKKLGQSHRQDGEQRRGVFFTP